MIAAICVVLAIVLWAKIGFDVYRDSRRPSARTKQTLQAVDDAGRRARALYNERTGATWRNWLD